MEAVMGGDKATQERLQARADAAENERQAMMDEAINRTKVSTSILFKIAQAISMQVRKQKISYCVWNRCLCTQ
jgi:hypothetical protein